MNRVCACMCGSSLIDLSSFSLFAPPVTSERDSFAQSVSILTQEKDAIQDKTQKYIAQMRDKYNATNEQSKKVWLSERREEEQHQLKSTMESLYAMLQTKIRTKDLYEGEEILGMVKAAIKNVIKQQQQA